MSGYHKTVEKYTYTETVYYDPEGNELGRHENYDTSWYDTVSEDDMTEEEIEDWT